MIKKIDLLNLYNSFEGMGNLVGAKFAYAISRNMNILKPEIESLDKALEFSPMMKEYHKKRSALAETHAKKDDKGKAIVEKGRYVLEDTDAFEKAFEALKLEYKDAIEQREKQVTEYNELLKTEAINLDLYKVKMEDVPKEITVDQMVGISLIIQD